jgi:hypothetical protein
MVDQYGYDNSGAIAAADDKVRQATDDPSPDDLAPTNLEERVDALALAVSLVIRHLDPSGTSRAFDKLRELYHNADT